MKINLNDILDNIYGGVYYVDQNRKIKYWNKEAEEITGFSKTEVIGKHCYDNILQHVDDQGTNLCHNGCPLHATMEDGKKREANVYLHHKDGQRVPVTIRTVPLKNEKNEIVGAAELFLKNIKMKSLEEKINELKQENHRDKLTEINNRNYLEKILAEIIKRDDINKDNIAFCFLDVDDFKYINDNYGHLVGDRILAMIANTLKNNLRDADKAFRWGGDEFALILFDINNNKYLKNLLERLKLLINESFIEHKQEKINVTMSFGATKFRKNDTIESLTKRADNNMYESKKQGKNQITVN
jgi:diguanylate cyclase (GGDEF)-like protein/PAS domain S-box-containing protein